MNKVNIWLPSSEWRIRGIQLIKWNEGWHLIQHQFQPQRDCQWKNEEEREEESRYWQALAPLGDWQLPALPSQLSYLSVCTGELIRGLMIGEMGPNNKKHDDLSLRCWSLCHSSYPTFDCHAWELVLSSISSFLMLIKWFVKVPPLSS